MLRGEAKGKASAKPREGGGFLEQEENDHGSIQPGPCTPPPYLDAFPLLFPFGQI